MQSFCRDENEDCICLPKSQSHVFRLKDKEHFIHFSSRYFLAIKKRITKILGHPEKERLGARESLTVTFSKYNSISATVT